MHTIDYELLHNHAVIRFSGELTWESATELAERIELVIHSPGGLTAALEHLARSIAGSRERGVHLRTRVVASAESAAAVLLSMGDERIAEPEARLLYHLSRVLDPGAVTAHAGAQIHDELARIDARIIGGLVERALRGSNAAHPHQAAPSRSPVSGRVTTGIAERACRRRAVPAALSPDPRRREPRCRYTASTPAASGEPGRAHRLRGTTLAIPPSDAAAAHPPRFNEPRPAGPAPFVPSPPRARELGYDTATQHPGPCGGAGHRRRPLPHRAPCGASGRWREGKPEGAGKRGNQSPDACAGASHELRHRAAPRLPRPRHQPLEEKK